MQSKTLHALPALVAMLILALWLAALTPNGVE
jgi:hypothetical protein